MYQPQDMLVIMLEKGQKPVIMYDVLFYTFSDPYVITIETKNNDIFIDLGYERGMKKIATIVDGSLIVDYFEEQSATLGTFDCLFLYNTLKFSIIKEIEFCNKDFETSALATYSSNKLQKIADHPGFMENLFKKYCSDAFETKKMPDYENFSREVCNKR